MPEAAASGIVILGLLAQLIADQLRQGFHSLLGVGQRLAQQLPLAGAGDGDVYKRQA